MAVRTAERTRRGSRGKGRTGREVMNAAQALTFPKLSVASWLAVDGALTERNRPGCSCKPYDGGDEGSDSVLTFGRWIALGFCVRKGEKAIRLSTWVPLPGRKVEGEEAADVKLRPHVVNLFCRCQVDPLAVKEA